jgi:alanine dehydrogenase
VSPTGTLLLTRGDVASVLTLDSCMNAVEQAYRLENDRVSPPALLGVHARDGVVHVKAAGMELDRIYIAVKANANFFQNASRFGLPTIQGLIILFDGGNGYPLAVMDSIEITIQRTGAATALAAARLARTDARVATICGCGNQGRIQLKALTRVLALERAYAFDVDELQAVQFAIELMQELGITVHAVKDLAPPLAESQVVVTCTPSRQPLLDRGSVAPGTFVAAVGADNPAKQELDPTLFVSGKVVVDDLEQCARIGDLHHALDAGVLTRDEVYATLREVITGSKPGRTAPDEVIIFDSTGTALQDVAAAVTVYERALISGAGVAMDFARHVG